MGELEDRTDALLPRLTSVPPKNKGICRICHGPSGSMVPSNSCKSCKDRIHSVSWPLQSVAPITTYWKDRAGGYGPIYPHLRDYKQDGASNELQLDVAALIVRFLRTHKGCLEQHFGHWTSIVVPPSTSAKRAGTMHPLEARLRATSLKSQFTDSCLTLGSKHVENREASDRRYMTTRNVSGEKILLIDDTWVTGSRVLSAASRLALSGATVVGCVVVGRQIDPTWRHDDRSYWEMVTERPFQFSDCCLAEPPHTDT
jgi:hypothetical protein